MKKVAVRDACLFLNGEKHLMVSGEFHYWRHDRGRWDDIFDRIEEMGIRIVSTFVPFNFHEISRGVFDFAGQSDPRRDLPAWLQRARKKGFLVILRPAPNEAGEWPNGGLPDRLLKYHRLHPTYIREVKRYYDALIPVFKPFLATRKGPIVMVQADNEPHADLRGRFEQIVGSRGRGLFAKWLKAHYGNVSALNDKWNACYKSFAQARPYYEETIVERRNPALRRLLPNTNLEARFVDTQRFAKWYAAEIVRWTAEYFREAGVDVPLSANTWHPSALDFIDLRDVVDCAGIDIYAARNLIGGPEFAHGTQDVFKAVLESLKLATAQLGYAYLPEYGAGLPSFWLKSLGVAAGNHPLYVALTCLSYGMKGMAYYMIVNRDNWALAPIDEWGRPTALFDTYREIIDITRKLNPPSMKNCCDISLLADKGHRIADRGNYEDVLDVLVEADLDFELFDPDASRLPATKCLVYGGSERLAREHQERLLEYAEKGGKIIFFSRFPCFDETGRPCNVLDIPLPSGIRPVSTPLNIACGRSLAYLSKRGHCGHGIHVFHYESSDIAGCEPITAHQLMQYLAIPGGDGVYQTRDTKLGDATATATMGFTRKVGAGEIAVVGMNPSTSVLSLLMAHTGVPWYSRSYEPDILTTIHRKRGGKLVLFVKNGNPEPAAATVHLQTQSLGIRETRFYELRDMRKNKAERLRGSELSEITTSVPAFDVSLFLISPRR